MGSGETAPTMVGTHRQLAGLLANGPATVRSLVRAALLDTPYGFQENASELAERAVNYFSESIDVNLAVTGLTRLSDGDPLQVERGLNLLRSSDYIFAGPGSPTYALREWADTDVPSIISSKLTTGGIVVFASAAALTLGTRTVPVYEIYKCGSDPYWLDGLSILTPFGINAVVIPHYNNTEGGHHDTRFCYLGERRLAELERSLQPNEWVLGIDEHTGLVIDLINGTADVVGNSNVTIRIDGQSQTFSSGTRIALEQLVDPEHINAPQSRAAATGSDATTDATAPGSTTTPSTGADTSLGATTDRCSKQFGDAIDHNDAETATRAALELEHAITAWSADTLQSDDADRARAALRSMITRLGHAAAHGLVDRRDLYSPFVNALLEIRAVARSERRFDISDLIRDHLDAIGIEVRDTTEGVDWELASDG